MESKVFIFYIKGSNILLKLDCLCGTQSGKQSCKRKLRASVHGWHEGSNIYQGLFDLWWNSKWQTKVMRMRHDMLLHSLKLGRLVIWDEYCCQGKQAREKWMRHELMCICCLKLESLHMNLNGEFILIKKISCMTQINVKFKIDG